MIYQTISQSKSGFSYTNPTKIKEHFNWEPKFSLDMGIIDILSETKI